MRDYPDFIIANAYVKLAAAQTNHSLGVINDEIAGAMSEACREIIDGKWHENFPIDMIQGETINNMLKNTAQIVHSRHRSVNNFIMNLISALGAYCFFDNKPKALQGYCIAPNSCHYSKGKTTSFNLLLLPTPNGMGRRRIHAAFILYKTLGYPELGYSLLYCVSIFGRNDCSNESKAELA